MLILSADVGEGHAAAARALAEQLEAGPDPVDVRVIDGLAGMGRTLRYVVEDGYRTQLRVMPWSYTVIYWLLDHVRPVRWTARRLLCLFGARKLRRHIDAHDPDVIVSTYPAVTVVLSRLRRLGHVRCPTMATITDLTGLFFWAQPGIDRHLVMYGESVELVRAIAGPQSVDLVGPLISEEFLIPCDRAEARRALDLPADGRVVIVSGGGWGVGDISGAVAELLTLEDATLVCLAGRNEEAQRRLEADFAREPRVRVLGFTREMPRLLAAADALVHSTGGVTCLEAMARGCPVVSYGLPVGHAKINTRAMHELGLLRLAHSRRELVDEVEAACASRAAAGARPAGAPRASDLVLGTTPRVAPIPAWRLRANRVAAQAMVVVAASTWMLSTDEFTAFAARLMGVTPIHHVRTSRRDVALVLRAPESEVPEVAARLSSEGLHASFAFRSSPGASTVAVLRSARDDGMPELGHARLLRWTATRSVLSREARALGLGHRFYFLAPSAMTTGQLLLARTVRSARPVSARVALDARRRVPQRPLAAGDVVVDTVDGSAASLRGLDALAARLRSEGLGSESLPALASPAIRAARS